jgi:hypothetical protein
LKSRNANAKDLIIFFTSQKLSFSKQKKKDSEKKNKQAKLQLKQK